MTKHGAGGSFFRSQKFTDWATVKEALIAREIDAVFILAPMAMRLRQDGVPIKVVSERLGHASVAFTMQVYQHVLPGMQADAAATFGEIVFGE